MKLRYIILLLLIVSGVYSCKKELISDQGQYTKIYMPQAVDYPAERPLTMADTLQSFLFGAARGGVEDQMQTINVQFQADEALVDSFNIKNGTDYEMMPAGSYELEKTEALIPSGQLSSEAIKVNVKTVGAIEPLKQYLLPISIEQVSPSIPLNQKLQTAYFLIKGTYEDFDRTGWSILSFSSEDIVQIAPLVLDGNTTTMWHTQWRGGTINPPHDIAIDMKASKSMHGVYMWSDNRTTGAPKDIHIDLSTDGQSWSDAGDYTLPNTNERHTIYFDSAKQARYFKVTVKNTHGNLAVTRLTEIGAF